MSIPAASPNHEAKGSCGKRLPQCKLIWTAEHPAKVGSEHLELALGAEPHADGSEHASHCSGTSLHTQFRLFVGPCWFHTQKQNAVLVQVYGWSTHGTYQKKNQIIIICVRCFVGVERWQKTAD